MEHSKPASILAFCKYVKLLLFLIITIIVGGYAVQASTQNLQHDGNGNLVSGDGYYRIYNSFNQLSKVYEGDNESGKLLVEFEYDLVEDRVLIKKIYNESGDIATTILYPFKEFVIIQNASGEYQYTYIYQNDQLIAIRQPDGSKLFLHPDNLGSTTLITDENGNPVETTFYSPDGDILLGGDVSRYGYTGKEYDEVLGDYDFNARR